MRHREALGGDSSAFGLWFDIVLLRSCQQSAAQVEPGGAMAVGEEAVVAEPMQAIGQRVQQ